MARSGYRGLAVGYEEGLQRCGTIWGRVAPLPRSLEELLLWGGCSVCTVALGDESLEEGLYKTKRRTSIQNTKIGIYILYKIDI